MKKTVNNYFVSDGFEKRLALALDLYNLKNTKCVLTFSKLAELIGVKYRNIVDWRKDRYKPQPKQLFKLAETLDINLNWLATGITTEPSLESINFLQNELIKYIKSVHDENELIRIKYMCER